MKLLLDTHVFLWFIAGDPQLPARFREAIEDPANDVFLSVAAVWEAVIKYHLDKLPLPEPPQTYLPRQRDRLGIVSRPIDEGAMTHLAALPPIHRDPFDRIMVAQALQFDDTVLTVDDAVRAYPIKFLLPDPPSPPP